MSQVETLSLGNSQLCMVLLASLFILSTRDREREGRREGGREGKREIDLLVSLEYKQLYSWEGREIFLSFNVSGWGSENEKEGTSTSFTLVQQQICDSGLYYPYLQGYLLFRHPCTKPPTPLAQKTCRNTGITLQQRR